MRNFDCPCLDLLNIAGVKVLEHLKMLYVNLWYISTGLFYISPAFIFVSHLSEQDSVVKPLNLLLKKLQIEK